jgi:hypothetical protein
MADAVIGPTRGGIHLINRLKPLQFTLGTLGILGTLGTLGTLVR